MKPKVVTFLLFLACVLCSGFTDNRLRVRTVAVDGASRMWDFSAGEAVDDCPVYRSYGDTLLTEYFNGHRQWYGFRGDTTVYLGEESRLIRLIPQDTILTAAFGNGGLFGVKAESDSGRFCRRYPLGTSGVYRSEPPVEGLLVLAEGDTMPAVAVREIRNYRRWLVSDTLPGLSREVTRTRWFLEGMRLPVVLQITDITSDSTGVIRSYTEAYRIDSNDLEDILTPADRLQQALRDADITVESGMVTVSGAFPEGTVLMLSISGLMGNGLMQRELTCDGEGLCRMSLPSLNPGQYILTVSAGTPVNRKVIINE